MKIQILFAAISLQIGLMAENTPTPKLRANKKVVSCVANAINKSNLVEFKKLNANYSFCKCQLNYFTSLASQKVNLNYHNAYCSRLTGKDLCQVGKGALCLGGSAAGCGATVATGIASWAGLVTGSYLDGTVIVNAGTITLNVLGGLGLIAGMALAGATVYTAYKGGCYIIDGISKKASRRAYEKSFKIQEILNSYNLN